MAEYTEASSTPLDCIKPNHPKYSFHIRLDRINYSISNSPQSHNINSFLSPQPSRTSMPDKPKVVSLGPIPSSKLSNPLRGKHFPITDIDGNYLAISPSNNTPDDKMIQQMIRQLIKHKLSRQIHK